MSKKNIGKKQQEIPFDSFYSVPIPANMALDGIVAIFKNSRYSVSIKQVDNGMTGPDGEVAKISHLTVEDIWGRGIPYKDRMRIKNNLCGNNSEMVEIYPGKWRERTDFKNYHFWALPIGAMFPFGIVPDDPEKAIMNSGGVFGDGIPISKEDLEVYVISDGSFSEVFADKKEAEYMYAENGNKPCPDGKIMDMVNAPQDGDDNTGWSIGAKKKKIALHLRTQKQIPDSFENRVSLNEKDFMNEEKQYDDQFENGPEMVEDKIVFAENMKNGIDNRRKCRLENLKTIISTLDDGD